MACVDTPLFIERFKWHDFYISLPSLPYLRAVPWSVVLLSEIHFVMIQYPSDISKQNCAGNKNILILICEFRGMLWLPAARRSFVVILKVQYVMLNICTQCYLF